MTESFTADRVASVLKDLARLGAERAELETGRESRYSAATSAADKKLAGARTILTAHFEAASRAAQTEYDEIREKIQARFAADSAAVEQHKKELDQRAIVRFRSTTMQLKEKLDEQKLETETVYEMTKGRPKQELEKVQKSIARSMERLQAMRQDAELILATWKQRAKVELPDGAAASEAPAAAGGAAEAATPQNPFQVLPERIAQAEAELVKLYGLKIPIFFKRRAKEEFAKTYPVLRRRLDEADQAAKQALLQAAVRCKRQQAEMAQRRENDLRTAQETFAQKTQEITAWRDENLTAAQQQCQGRIAELTEKRDRLLAQGDEKYPRLLEQIKQQFETNLEQAKTEHGEATGGHRERRTSERSSLAQTWESGIQQALSTIDWLRAEDRRLFPAWMENGVAWSPPKSAPPGVRFGELDIRAEQVFPPLAADDQLNRPPERFSLPALLTFPDRCSMLFKAADEGRARAVEAVQGVMLRLLTSIPPGKVRFTIMDPVGLGENFAAFMHLADYDDALVNSRIWTEPKQIEERLAEITDYMETVIQTYLRNEFASIDEYNAYAGEIAEPFRILVIANFPANFSEAACRRLLSIVASGARCGVYTLITLDTRQPLPPGVRAADLEDRSVTLVWRKDRFVWKDDDFQQFPLTLDAPPPPERVTQLLHEVGQQAKHASKVQVPFEVIAPPEAEWWRRDSRDGVSVPLGRAGATKLQSMQLGQGVSQHVLVAGKTGSGKSTLLHALVTNLSLFYSPDEVQFYLVDFKRGVEFKTYATHELPHARVVAIESDREFGLSVLERLDAELKERGVKYRELGVQDVKSYRAATGSVLPRILLIIDEFQEIFVEDDRIARDAALLFDRLVRQGRAFGIHVILGSQTLGGAYTLARSTLGQLAVRIALQCSDADARLILSEDNGAARLLSRPGEAIYNDANGLVEGNHPFQVVWLPDATREGYLQAVHELAERRPPQIAPAQIVFEGAAPANPAKNELLTRLLNSPPPQTAAAGAQAWLGEAVAIKDPTAAAFRRQSGSNLLIVGQNGDAALGILTTAVVALAAQHPKVEPENSGARFFLLDGSPADGAASAALGLLAELFPAAVQAARVRETAAVMGAVSEELARRQQADLPEAPPVYLFAYALQGLRDLRKQEDDFSFSRMGESEPASPAKQLAAILREGPALGIHTIIWCDNLNNVNRALDRQGLREFEMRVLFQMSQTDSSTLIDSPAAGKLGLHRALFHSEEHAQVEKFRPYATSEEWLRKAAAAMADRLRPAEAP